MSKMHFNPNEINPLYVVVKVLVDKGIITEEEVMAKRDQLAEEKNKELEEIAKRDPVLKKMMDFSDKLEKMREEKGDMTLDKLNHEEMGDLIDMLKGINDHLNKKKK